MLVRAISALEIADFARWSAGADRGYAPEDATAFQGWLDRLWASGRSEPRLCLVAEQENAPAATAVFWRHEDMAHVEHLTGSADACVALVEWAALHLAELGVRRIWAESIAPPASDERTAEVGAILEHAAFDAVDEGVRFELEPVVVPPADDTLEWRGFSDLGRGAFEDALARCLEGTLDPLLARDAERKGVREAAHDHLQRLLGLDGDRAWWHLAYAPEGDLVGMVLPSMAEGPILNFVGVVPAWRGHGRARALLQRGIAALADEEADWIRADASTKNEPMTRALRSAGFRPFAKRHVWDREIGAEAPYRNSP